jgi:hypothetical protein
VLWQTGRGSSIEAHNGPRAARTLRELHANVFAPDGLRLVYHNDSRARAFIARAELAALVVPPGEHEPDAGYARHVLVAHRHCSDRVAPEPWLAARRRAQVTVDRPPPHPKKVPHAIVRSERGSRPTHELRRLFVHYCGRDGQGAVQWAACDDKVTVPGRHS